MAALSRVQREGAQGQERAGRMPFIPLQSLPRAEFQVVLQIRKKGIYFTGSKFRAKIFPCI